jgi:RNA polymerase sigma-70 factor (ECF subfamily)
MKSQVADRVTPPLNAVEALFPSRLEAAQGGCTESFGVLAEHCRQYLLLIATGELGGDLRVKVAPSDLVQETMVLAQRGIQQFSGKSEGEFRMWMRQILLHYTASVGRRYRQASNRDIGREVRLDAYPSWDEPGIRLVADDTPPVARVERDDEGILLRHALGKLSATHRQVLVHRSVDEMPFSDIGELLGISADASRKLWVRAVAALQREIKRGHSIKK